LDRLTVEEISDDDGLYRRIRIDHFYKDGSIMPVAFYLNGKPDNEISVDLARLSSPRQTQGRAPKPELFGIGILLAEFPRSLGFDVRHTPRRHNPAHAQIEGRNTMENCDLLARHTSVVLKPER
jgi:hypothetical protein